MLESASMVSEPQARAEQREAAVAPPRPPAARRRAWPLGEVVARWAEAHGCSFLEALRELAGLLARHPQCLAVACDRLSEIRRGVEPEVMAERRQRAVAEIKLAARSGEGLDGLNRHTVRADRLARVLHEAGREPPAFLPPA